jgi:hypothetical protein
MTTNRISHYLQPNRFRAVRRALTTCGFCECIERIHLEALDYRPSELAGIAAMFTANANLLEAVGYHLERRNDS